MFGVGVGTGMGSGIRCTYFILVTLHTTHFKCPCIYCVGVVVGVSLTEAARNGYVSCRICLLYPSACGPLAC